MTDLKFVPKKPRAPMSAEHKRKLSESAKLRGAAEALAIHRKKAWSAETRVKREQNTKSAQFVTEELYPLLLKLDRATRDKRIMDLLAADPIMEARLNEWDGITSVTFARAAGDIIKQYGKPAYAIWQKLFICVQQGGLDRAGKGFPSIWSMNHAAIGDYLAEHSISSTKLGRAPTISEAIEMLLPHDALRRVWADWEVTLKEQDGYERVVVEYRGKKVLASTGERQVLRKARKAVSAEASEARALLQVIKS